MAMEIYRIVSNNHNLGKEILESSLHCKALEILVLRDVSLNIASKETNEYSVLIARRHVQLIEYLQLEKSEQSIDANLEQQKTDFSVLRCFHISALP